jgi:hypothetical protein
MTKEREAKSTAIREKEREREKRKRQPLHTVQYSRHILYARLALTFVLERINQIHLFFIPLAHQQILHILSLSLSLYTNTY